jgi:hypothetical protein
MSNHQKSQNFPAPTEHDPLQPATRELESTHLEEAIELLRDCFNEFDEIWLVGHKGDHHRTLQELQILPDTQLDLVHAHSTLGADAKKIIEVPEGSSSSYEGLLTKANPQLKTEIERVKEEDKQVCVLMPFVNEEFQQMIEDCEATANFTLTAPISDYTQYLKIENKILFAQLIDRALEGWMDNNLIPWDIINQATTYEDLLSQFNRPTGSTFYLQIDLSGGGDGTIPVSSQEEIQQLKIDTRWQEHIDERRVKVTPEVLNNYPANGGACIIPNGDGTCDVLVDPPSHKPVGLDALGSKSGSGGGNDWTIPWPKQIREQYIQIVQAIGELLYQEFGYTGFFGPDCMVANPHSEDEARIYINEINPRWQGTTPYQTLNSILDNRIPLEIIHYLLKFAERDPSIVPKIRKLIADTDSYNRESVNSSGGYYIKIGAPKNEQEISVDMNGAWAYDRKTEEIRQMERITAQDIYTGRPPPLKADEVAIYIKGPNKGDMVGGQLAPVGYIIGNSQDGEPVFKPDEQGITEFGLKMYQKVRERMFE